jgi:NAD(P)H-dependent flavin oxidoreductase YrpB (nitropropane dioxygenase family)
VPAAVFAGNIEHGSGACGAIAGIINDIPAAKEVIRRLVGGYEALVATL